MERMKYMIVDDNAGMREMIRLNIPAEGNDFLECPSGADAVAQFSRFRPDFVMMDIEMKGMDGFAATEKIYEQDPQAKIIFVTDHDTSAFHTKAKKLHAAGFVSKENLSEIAGLLRL